MGIQRNWGRSRQQWCGFESPNININRDVKSECGNGRRSNNRKCNFFVRCLRHVSNKQLHDPRTWWSLSIYPDVSRTRDDQSDPDPKSNHYKKCHRHNKHVYAIGGILLSLVSPTASLAQGVGGVSATANPIANSSGSVTNQAIQVLQGPYVTNTYGGGVSCQGTTLNMTPYLQFADSRKDPWEDFYNEPQYNLTDKVGSTVEQAVTVKNYPWETWYDNRTKDDGTRWFEDGDDITIIQTVPTGDGVPDAISNGTLAPTWYKPVRTDMRANQSFNLGLSATLSIPLNRGMQRKCAEAAQAQNDLVVQTVANKRLDFEIARLKNCGELKKAGIFFHPNSPYASICADVIVTNPGGKIVPHTHEIPQPNFEIPSSSETSSSSDDSSQTVSQEDPSSPDTDSSSSQLQSNGKGFFQGLSLPWSQPSSQQVSQPSGASQLGVWQVGHSMPPQMLSQPSSSQSED